MNNYSWNFVKVSFILLLFSTFAKTQTTTIDLSSEKQYIRGFGGINMPGWINDLTAAQADKAFGNETGQIGMSILRVRVPFDESKFNLEVPTAVRAKSHGAIIMASPWSPPAGMKTNDNTVGGSLDSAHYGDFADHLDSFANYMSLNGASLYAISLQNEPDVSVTYESCDWNAKQMIDFLTTQGSRITTRIIAPESYKFDMIMTDSILNDEVAASHVDIIAGHLYGGGLEDHPLARSKGKEVWMTEHLVVNSDWAGAIETGKEISDCMKYNFSAYLWWYIRRSYGPIDESGNVSKRGYVMSQFAKFIRPGFTRVDATASADTNICVTAYKNDTAIVIVALNLNSTPSSVDITVQNGIVSNFTKYTTSSSKNVNNDGTISAFNNTFNPVLDANSITTFTGSYSHNPTGLSKIENKFDFKINSYPNPFTNQITIEFKLEKVEHVKLDVVDITGRKITTLVNGMQQAGKNKFIFDGSQLERGIYFCQFNTGDYHAMKMIIKK